ACRGVGEARVGEQVDLRVDAADVVHLDRGPPPGRGEEVGQEDVGRLDQAVEGSRPAGRPRSRPTLRLPRFGCSTMKLTPPVGGTRPEVTSPRCGSPLAGCSILITSAPQSASTAPAAGTNHHCATSTTRTPCRTPLMAGSLPRLSGGPPVRSAAHGRSSYSRADSSIAAFGTARHGTRGEIGEALKRRWRIGLSRLSRCP